MSQGTIYDESKFGAVERYVVACLVGVALWNCIETVPIVLVTFVRYSGLYFWSK